MRKYELIPTDGRKSFYGTPIVKRLVSGELVKMWDGWTATTGRHIKAFCGLNKAAYMSL